MPRQTTDRGRIFRVAPKGNRYTVPKFDFNTIDGAIDGVEEPLPVGPLYGVDQVARCRRERPNRRYEKLARSTSIHATARALGY